MDRKEAILDAALELFSERGFHGATVAMIAERADVGAGTIYRYFTDKDDLVNALFQHWKKTMAGALLTDLPTDLSPRKLLRELWHRFARFSRDHPLALSFLEFHCHASYLTDASRELADGFRDRFLEMFERLRREQITKDVPPELVFALITGAFVGVEKAFQAGELERTPEMEALAEEMCWEAIRR
ncbi:MAG: TetR/AcrR family transcriptional regulator [Thermodesulfobacteriota bacterium]